MAFNDVNDAEKVLNGLWILRNFRDLDETPFYLEHLIKQQERPSNSLLRSILFTAVTIFPSRPAEMQHMLAEIFELCLNSKNEEIIFKANLYANLLQNEQTINILCNDVD